MRASWGVGDAPSSRDTPTVTANVQVKGKVVEAGTNWAGRRASMPMTPPLTPWSGPVDSVVDSESAGRSSLDSIPALSPVSSISASFQPARGTFRAEPGSILPLDCVSPGVSLDSLPRRAVLLYVGRVSWEKNLHLLLAAYPRLSPYLTAGTLLPKLVFVGDGPARIELEAICARNGYDATFMGHRSGEELARCYASADVFAFPSFTEVSSDPF